MHALFVMEFLFLFTCFVRFFVFCQSAQKSSGAGARRADVEAFLAALFNTEGGGPFLRMVVELLNV